VAKETVLADATFDFSGGVNSDAVTTIRSDLVTNGLQRNQLAWLSNGTTRGGAISPRPGYNKLLDLIATGLYQGGILYEPIQEGDPYIICSVSGHIIKALLSPPYTVTDLSVQFGLVNPATPPEVFFVEAEGILCIQAGDYFTNPPGTLPLFYRSSFGGQPEVLRRSNGLTGNVTYPNINEIPAATCMVYYLGRLWYAQGRKWTAGDIVGNQASGTAPYNFTDSVFKVTENPLAVGGDGFTVPSQAGVIRAMRYTANLDTSLGQGPLYIFTRKQVYSFNPPVTRTAWIAANNNTQPIVTVAQINNGATGERGLFHVNGDLFYQSLTPDVRTLFIATRYFKQWANVGISRNVQRAMQFVNRAIQRYCPGVDFDNRGLNGTLPKQTANGVISQGILPLNFDEVSTLEEQRQPVWDGMWEGIDALQLFSGDFGGLQRAFAPVVSRQDGTLDIWELTTSQRTENGDNRILWYAEFPAFTWSVAGWELSLKELMGGELWLDRVSGEIELQVFYRPDADPCWHPWLKTAFCSTRNCAEDVNNPICYPTAIQYCDGYQWPFVLPKPPEPSGCQPMIYKRPRDQGFQFQVKVQVKGYLRIRGIVLYAQEKERGIWEGLRC